MGDFILNLPVTYNNFIFDEISHIIVIIKLTYMTLCINVLIIIHTNHYA